MNNRWDFTDKTGFLQKVDELIASGVPASRIETITPYYVHEVDELLRAKKAPLEAVAIAGAITGGLAALALTYGSALSWPLITGGKPVVSIMQYGIIVFELAVLFGGLASFLGFLAFGKFPKLPSKVTALQEHGNRFIVIVSETEAARE